MAAPNQVVEDDMKPDWSVHSTSSSAGSVSNYGFTHHVSYHVGSSRHPTRADGAGHDHHRATADQHKGGRSLGAYSSSGSPTQKKGGSKPGHALLPGDDPFGGHGGGSGGGSGGAHGEYTSFPDDRHAGSSHGLSSRWGPPSAAVAGVVGAFGATPDRASPGKASHEEPAGDPHRC
jgi:hypothetical protein